MNPFSFTFGRRWFVKAGIGAALSVLGFSAWRWSMRSSGSLVGAEVTGLAEAILPSELERATVETIAGDFLRWVSSAPPGAKRIAVYQRDMNRLRSASLIKFQREFSQLSVPQRQELLTHDGDSLPALAKDLLNRYFESGGAHNLVYQAAINPLTARPLFASISKPLP